MFHRDPHVFKAPEFANVVKNAIKCFSQSPLCDFPPDYPDMSGRGVYGLYYFGDYELYSPIAQQNRATQDRPIYIGKAVATGGRTGITTELDKSIAGRIREHFLSITAAKNSLRADDFMCRFIFLGGVEEDLIEVLERRLIKTFQPLWNSPFLAGFGNHDPGGGRYQQQRSFWDTLHPGRNWALRLQENKKKSKAEIEKDARQFLLRPVQSVLISSDDPPQFL